MYIFVSPVKCVFEPSKENKSKTINAKKKTRTVLESASNSAQNFESRFLIFVLFFDEGRFSNKNYNYFFFSPEKQNKNRDSMFC